MKSSTPQQLKIAKNIETVNKNSTEKLSKKDFAFLAIILAVACFFTFINLGTTKTPQSEYLSSEWDEVIVEIKEDTDFVANIYLYMGISEREDVNIAFFQSDSRNGEYASVGQYVVKNVDMYRFITVKNETAPVEVTKKFVKILFTTQNIRVEEIFFANALASAPLKYEILTNDIENIGTINDEHNYFSSKATNINGMYFDEIYHARTAYEILNDMTIYETTHPQLGKILISLGISVFGMNPFGYRIIPAIFSIFVVLLAYLFGKKMFKSTLFACLFAVFFTCEGLRLVQGRFATLDTFITFFVMLEYFFMYSFFKNGINYKKVVKSLIPFALAGITFGLSIASKWTGFYAVIGLFILFLVVIVKEYVKFYTQKSKIISNMEFVKFNLLTVLFGVVFFVVIPFVIYYFSFSVYMISTETKTLSEVFWMLQNHMFSYHSGLNDAHTSHSIWLSWLVNAKSVYMYYGDTNFGNGYYSRINSMSTTALSILALYSIVRLTIVVVQLSKKIRIKAADDSDKLIYKNIFDKFIFLVIGFASNLLPWAFITRSTFLYHFYPSIPFYIGFIVLYLYYCRLTKLDIVYKGEIAILNMKNACVTRWMKNVALFSGLIVVNFLLFYPAFTGLPISSGVAMIFFGWANGFWGYGLVPSL